jgi:MFS family permease
MTHRWATPLLSFGLAANLLPLMTFAATMPEAAAALALSPEQAGWVGGIFFAGYAAAVPILSGAADRLDPRRIYFLSCALGAFASVGFVVWVDAFYPALALRFLSGIALAGVHMPGLKLLTDYFAEGRGGRATGIYASSYALGSAGSFLAAGVVGVNFGWQATFVVAGVGPILAALAVWLLPPPPRRAAKAAPAPVRLSPLLKNEGLITYVIGFAGNTWEVFAIRIWFVAYLAWVLARPGQALDLPPLAIVSGLAAVAGVPISIAIAELSQRASREATIAVTAWVSVGICVALALTVSASTEIVLALLILLQITSFADVGALTGGAVASAEPERRGLSLGLYSFAGFVTGWLGPVAVGMILGLFGSNETGWAIAFLVMGLGSVVTALMMHWRSRRLRAV